MNRLLLAAEIGGTKLQAALGTDAGEILHVERGAAPAQAGADAILEWFTNSIPELLKHAESPVGAIGVGFGGPVESAKGAVLTSHQVEGWSGYPLKTWFEDRFKLPTHVFNDSNSAGWAEYCLGAGRGTRHFLYSNIGSGIGGALVIDGHLHDGQGFGAAEVGHTYVPDWENRTPGTPQKLENLCSGWSIERRVRNGKTPLPNTPLHTLCGGKPETITCAMLGEAARQGDSIATDEIERVGRSIGLALANVITLFHPERIALGGGVSLMGDILLDPIRRWANHYAFGPYRDRFEIVPCALGESVVIAGSLLLAGARQ